MNQRVTFKPLGVCLLLLALVRIASGETGRDALVIDSVNFEQVDLVSALAFLAAKAEAAGPGADPVNFVVIDPDGRLGAAAITLKLTRVPWSEALRYVAALVGAEVLTERHAITVGEKPSLEKLKLQRSKILSGPGSEATAALLASTVVEKVAFEGATLEEFADYLRQWDQARVSASPVVVNPLNVIVKESATRPVATRPIRLDLRRVPLGELLHYATGVADCRFRIDARAVVIGESDDLARPPGGPLKLSGPIFEQLAGKRLETIEIPIGSSTEEFVEVMRTLGGINTLALAPEAVAASRLALHRVSALEMLRYFNEVSGTAYRLDPNALVVIRDPAVKVLPKPPSQNVPLKPVGGGNPLGFDP